jgi:hypothetical protein
LSARIRTGVQLPTTHLQPRSRTAYRRGCSYRPGYRRVSSCQPAYRQGSMLRPAYGRHPIRISHPT